MTACTALVLAAALAAEGRLEAGVRLRAEGRDIDPPTATGESRTLDVSAAPRLSLGLTAGRGSLAATYAPTFTDVSVTGHARLDIVHTGELRLRLASDSTFEAEAFGTATAGRSELLRETTDAAGSGGGGTDTPTSTVLTTQRVRREGVRSGLSLRLSPDRRTELRLMAAVSQDGGADVASRRTYPVVRAADASAEALTRVTRLDQVGLRGQGAMARLAALRTDSSWVSAMATWSHSLSPRLRVSSGAGVLELQSRSPATPPTRRESASAVHPAADLALTLAPAPLAQPGSASPPGQQVARSATGELGASLSGTVDRQTGRASRQAQGRASLSLPLGSATTAFARGSGGQRWTETGTAREGRVDLGLSFRLASWAVVGVSGYGTWQRGASDPTQDLTIYGASLTLALEAPAFAF